MFNQVSINPERIPVMTRTSGRLPIVMRWTIGRLQPFPLPDIEKVDRKRHKLS